MLHDQNAFVIADRAPLVHIHTPMESAMLGLLVVPLTAAWLPVVGLAVGLRALARSVRTATR